MRYNELTQEEYTAALKVVIIGAEGLHARAQNVGNRMVTIGYGYTFNRGNNAAIRRASAIDLTEGEWRALQAIDAAPDDSRARLSKKPQAWKIKSRLYIDEYWAYQYEIYILSGSDKETLTVVYQNISATYVRCR